MKTTIEIADDLFLKAKSKSKESKVTMRELVEEGLRRVLEDAPTENAPPIAMTFGAVDGNGLNPEFQGATWDHLLETIYPTHGHGRG